MSLVFLSANTFVQASPTGTLDREVFSSPEPFFIHACESNHHGNKKES